MELVVDRDLVTPEEYDWANVWGMHATKIWSLMPQYINPRVIVHGAVLSSESIYTEDGVYMPFPGTPKIITRWMYSYTAVNQMFTGYTVYAPTAIWLTMKLGELNEDMLLLDSSVYGMLQPAVVHNVLSSSWRVAAAAVCNVLCEAVARDEYSRGF